MSYVDAKTTKRIQKKIENAIGEYIRVKTSRTGSIGGTIIAIEWMGFRYTPSNRYPQFLVTLESGTKKVTSEHMLEKLPKPTV